MKPPWINKKSCKSNDKGVLEKRRKRHTEDRAGEQGQMKMLAQVYSKGMLSPAGARRVPECEHAQVPQEEPPLPTPAFEFLALKT